MQWHDICFSNLIVRSETKDNYVLKAELPGLETKDVNISILGDILTIKGEKKAEKEIEVKDK